MAKSKGVRSSSRGAVSCHASGLAAAWLLLSASPVAAQDTDAGGPPVDAGIPDIIVTAQKYAQSANSVPMSITVATGDQLQQAGIKEVSDLVKITPGLTVTQSIAGSPVYTLRGIGFNDSSLGTRPAVTVYIDEAPVPFAVETRGAGLDVDHVEVLKGPQGTLFGSNSTGGAINYVAAKPTPTFEAGASATYGRFDELNFTGFVSGPVTDTLSVRLAIERQGSGDWQKSITRPGDTAGKMDFTNGRVSLLWKPDDRLQIALTANRWIDKSDFQSPQTVAIVPRVPELLPFTGIADYPAKPRDARFADWDPDSNLSKSNRFLMLTGRVDYEIDDSITLTSLTTFNDLDYYVPGAVDGLPNQNTDFILSGGSQTFAQEMRLAAKLDRVNIILGANYQHDTPTESSLQRLGDSTPVIGFNAFFGGPWRSARVNSRQRANSYAGFGNVEFAITPQLALQGGMRYTKTTIGYRGCLADAGDGNAAVPYTTYINLTRAAAGLAPIPMLQPGACITMDAVTLLPGLVSSRLEEDNVSWRAGVQFEPVAGTLLYANISKGYKSGGYASVNAIFSPTLDPAKQESVLGYEAGFKANMLGRALQLNGAAFYYDYQDKQLIGNKIDPVLGSLAALVNVPKVRVYGGEIQLAAAPFRGFTINGAGSYIRSDILSHYTAANQLGAVQDFHGTDVPNVPHWQWNASARYQWAVSSRLDMFMTASATHQGKSFSTLGNLETFRIDSFTLVDLSAGVESADGRWRAYLWGRNVFDKNYWTNNLSGLDNRAHPMGKPATYGITVGFNY